MNYMFEYKSFYREGDTVLIEYWYNQMITPVTIIERKGNKFLVTHKNNFSEIKNAPDEMITSSEILDHFK